MFIKIEKLAKLMKAAYKSTGLRVHNMTDKLAVEGSNWSCIFTTVPKEIRGEIIKLAGEIPEVGESANYITEGKQQMLGTFAEKMLNEPGTCYESTTICIGAGMVFQNLDTSEKVLVSANVVDVVDFNFIEKQEEKYIETSYMPEDYKSGIAWSDGETTYVVETISLGENEKRQLILDKLKEVDCVF